MADRQKLPADRSDENESVEKIDEILDALPQDKRKIIEKTMISSVAMVGRSSPEGEIAKKVSSEHITKMLENEEKAMDYTYKDEKSKKIFYGFIVGILLIAVFGIILLLRDMPETMERVLTVIVTAIISGLGGYGIGKGKKDD